MFKVKLILKILFVLQMASAMNRKVPTSGLERVLYVSETPVPPTPVVVMEMTTTMNI